MKKLPQKENRYNSAAKVALIALIINLALAITEIVVGFYFGFLAIIAAGFHYLFDTGFMAVTFFSFKFASKPADKEHPFGHERIEYIAALFLSAVLLVVSIDIIVEGIQKIISPENSLINFVIIIILICVIALKILLSVLYLFKNKKINSLTLKAAFYDSIFDIFTSLFVLIGLIFAKYTKFSIDGVLSIMIAGFMIFNAIKILKDSINHLIGSKPKLELRQKISKKLKSYPEILQIHELIIHNYGESNLFATVHVLLNEEFNLDQSKEFLDAIIADFKKENINIVIQIEGKKTS